MVVECNKPIARPRALAIVCGNRVFDRRSAAIVEEAFDRAQTPERRGSHFLTGGVTLANAVAERTHVVQQEIGVRVKGYAVECCDIRVTCPKRWQVAVRTADCCEHLRPGRSEWRDGQPSRR